MQLRAWLTWAVGQARAGRRRRARTDDGRRPAADSSRERGRRRESQNRDVTPWAPAWLTGADGRMGGYMPSRRRAA